MPPRRYALRWRGTSSLAIRGRVTLDDLFTFGNELQWAAIAPELLWPVWGAALGAATLAYYYRRRGRCVQCGRP